MIDLPTTLHSPPTPRMPRFDVPAAITPIDLTEDPATGARRLATQARTVLPGVTDERVDHLVAAQRGILDAMRAGGVYWAGNCLARSDVDPSRLTVAHLAASVVALETGIVDLHAAVAGLGNGAGSRVADVIQLPAGPAIVVIEEAVVHPASTAVGTAAGSGHRVRQVLVGVPVPDAPELAVLTLATEHLADWPAYLDLMATIAGSVVFTSR